MNPAREEALFTSALEIPDRLVSDSHNKQQKLQAAPEGVDAICDAFEAAWLAGHEPHIYDVLPSGNSVHRDLDQQ